MANIYSSPKALAPKSALLTIFLNPVNNSRPVPAAIHLAPEAVEGGIIAKIHEGDIVTLDAPNGILKLLQVLSGLPQELCLMHPTYVRQ